MTIRELIDELEDIADEHGNDIEVRLAQQPRWAFEYAIAHVVATDAKKQRPAVAYLGEGRQIGYLPSAAGVALGWSDARHRDDDDEDD